MKELTNFLLQFGNLNEQQMDLVESKATELELKKNEYFSEAGKIPRQIGFLTEGIVRVCYYNNKGEEITRYFSAENSLVMDYVNFEANRASSEYIQAVTDCKLLVYSKTDWQDIAETIADWNRMTDKMVQQCLIRKVRHNPKISQDATTRYLEFMEDFPMLVNRVPLVYIASYLGITATSLSRIRKNIR